MISSFLMGAALIAALFVQSSTSYMAGLWICLFLSGIFVTLFEDIDRPKKHKLQISVILFWLVYIIFHSIVINPVFHIFMSIKQENGNYLLYQQAFDSFTRIMVLVSLPAYALALISRGYETIKFHFHVFCTIIFAFACYICILQILGIDNIYKLYLYAGTDLDNIEKIKLAEQGYSGQSGTLINKNNAATLINIGLIISIGFLLKSKNIISSLFPVSVFAFALYATDSRAGLICAAASISLILIYKFPKIRIPAILACILAIIFVFNSGNAFSSFKTRFPIWESSIEMIKDHPVKGIGSGTFDYYYKRQYKKPEDVFSSGNFAHNDILHIAVENGIIAAVLFLIMIIGVFSTINRNNFITIAAIFNILLHSMVSFPFMIQSISLFAGLLIAMALCYPEKNSSSLGGYYE